MDNQPSHQDALLVSEGDLREGERGLELDSKESSAAQQKGAQQERQQEEDKQQEQEKGPEEEKAQEKEKAQEQEKGVEEEKGQQQEKGAEEESGEQEDSYKEKEDIQTTNKNEGKVEDEIESPMPGQAPVNFYPQQGFPGQYPGQGNNYPANLYSYYDNNDEDDEDDDSDDDNEDSNSENVMSSNNGTQNQNMSQKGPNFNTNIPSFKPQPHFQQHLGLQDNFKPTSGGVMQQGPHPFAGLGGGEFAQHYNPGGMPQNMQNKPFANLLNGDPK